ATPGAGRGMVRLDGREFGVHWRPDVPGGAEADRGRDDRPGEWTASLSLPASRFPLWLRGPRPGDRIRTRAGSKKLKKLFNEHRVPRSERGAVPVLESADGRVRWVAGLATDRSAGSEPGEERFVIGVHDLRRGRGD
ncbi:MAG: tRNA lysidine(34) synthetase TilS, partial [Gemmatimonadota bacterium]